MNPLKYLFVLFAFRRALDATHDDKGAIVGMGRVPVKLGADPSTRTTIESLDSSTHWFRDPQAGVLNISRCARSSED